MKALAWIAVPLMLVGAVMLLVDIGSSGLWIAVITIGIALTVMSRGRPATRS